MLDASASYAQSAVGTPYYLSPELCEGKQYNHKSDVWALGCLIYELCTFRHAFDATSLPALVMSIIRGEVEPIQHPYSPALVEAIRCCLRKDPGEQRFAAPRVRARRLGFGGPVRGPMAARLQLRRACCRCPFPSLFLRGAVS